MCPDGDQCPLMICAKPPFATATLNDSWLAGLPCRNGDGESSAASQSASLTRKSGMQPVKQPDCLCWASRKCGLNVACALQNSQQEGNMPVIQTSIQPKSSQPTLSSIYHPASPFNCSSMFLLPPSFPRHLAS